MNNVENDKVNCNIIEYKAKYIEENKSEEAN